MIPNVYALAQAEDKKTEQTRCVSKMNTREFEDRSNGVSPKWTLQNGDSRVFGQSNAES